MRSTNLRFLFSTVLACAAVLLVACSDGGTGPDGGDSRTASLQPLLGTGQQSTVATQLPEVLTVVALDAQGAPVAGTRVQFSVSQNGGSVSPASVTTDAQGRASTVWTLGTLAGTHRVSAAVGTVTAEFTAVANAGPPVSFALAQDSFALEPGMDSVLHYVALDAHGNANTTVTPTFVVDNPGVASVNATGAVVGVSPGRTTVRAQLGGLQDQATLNVGFRFVDIVSGYENTCARTAGDRVHCWGLTQDFQSGPPRPGEICQVDAFCLMSPQILTNDIAFTSVAPGLRHSCGVSTAGRLYCWGSNASLALGIGQTDWSYRTGQPQEVDATRSWRAVSADDSYTCALTAAGEAYCWGKPGALGGGLPPALPVSAPSRVGSEIALATIQASAENVCGLTAQNDLYCWGLNGNGQHGTADRTVHHTPVRAGGGVKYEAVALGGAHACGIGMDDRVTCWGSNSHGQLGVDVITESLTPIAVTTALTFTAIAAGATHTCGIATDGSSYCWGNNTDGQLGNGFVGSGWQPRPVAGGLGFTRIHAKRESTCGLATDTRLYCWGDNDNGQLGVGGTADRVAPARVLGQME